MAINLEKPDPNAEAKRLAKLRMREMKDNIVSVIVGILVFAVIAAAIGGLGYYVHIKNLEAENEKNFYIDSCSHGDMTACRVLKDHYRKSGGY